MARRRAPQTDVSLIGTSTDLKREGEFPFRVYSPNHSHPGRPKYFNLSVLEGTGELGHVLAREFLVFAAQYREQTADAHLVAVRSLFRSCVAQLRSEGGQLPSITASRWRQLAALWFYDLKADDAVGDITANSYLSSNKLYFLHLQKRFLVPNFRWPRAIQRANSKPRQAVSNAPVRRVLAKEISSWSEPDRAAWSELNRLSDLSSPTVIKRRINIILKAARRHAELEVRKWWQIFCESREIAARNTDFDFDGYCKTYEYVSDGVLKRRRGWRKPLRSLPNFLVYVERKFGGVMPGKGDDPDFVKCAYAHHAHNLQGRFHLEYESLIPLLTIIFIERPKMNLASPLSMTVKDLSQINRHEHQAQWTKARAKYRRLSDNMPSGSGLSLLPGALEEITAAQALLVIQELSKPLGAWAVPGAENHICLVRATIDGRVVGKPAAQSWICRQWTEFRTRSGLMSALDFTLSQFRPSGAIMEFFETGDIFKVAERLGQKSVRVTARYINNLAADNMDASKVRAVQDSLTIAVANQSGRSFDQLGISSERERQIRETAFSSGFLGYNISGTPEESDQKTTVLERILSGGKFFIIESPEIAAEIIAFKEHVIKNGKEIQGTARYEEFWLPLVVCCTQIINSMASSVIRDAKKILAVRPIIYGPVI